MGTFKHAYFSVGEFCATAHQIRRVTGVEDAFLFDWLITHGNNVRFLTEPDDGLLVSGQWTIVDDGLRVMDLGTGWLYQHEFETDDAHRVDPARVEAHLPVAREKFSYLKRKLLGALRACESGVLIRGEMGLAAADVPARLSDLRTIFAPINPALKYIIASPNIQQEVYGQDHLLLHLDLPDPSLGAHRWMGDNASWSRLFELAEAHLP